MMYDDMMKDFCKMQTHLGGMSKECGRGFWVQVIERSEKRPDKIMQREQPEMNEEPEQEPGNPVCVRRLKAVAGSPPAP